MVRIRSIGLVALLAATTFACVGEQGDDYWYPEEAPAGKADGNTVETVPGTDIPSALVDVNRSYLRARKIEYLDLVGALSPDQLAIANRVDGIITNLPTNGQIHIAELVKMEDPAIFGSLFPAEQAALEYLWQLLEAPEANVVLSTPQLPKETSFNEIMPALVPLPDSMPIADLYEHQGRSAAQRLQLQFDIDNNPDTVSIADLDEGINDTVGRYTPDEVAKFKITKSIIGRIRANVPPGHATLELPKLGNVHRKLGEVGTSRVYVSGDMYVVERGWECLEGSSFGAYNSNGYLGEFVNDVELIVRAPSDTWIIVQDYRGNENAGQPNTGPKVPLRWGSTSVIEVWENGIRTDSAFVVSSAEPLRFLELTDQVGFSFQDTSGDPILRSGDRQIDQKIDLDCNTSSGSIRRQSNMWVGQVPQDVDPQAELYFPSSQAAPLHYGSYEFQLPSGEILGLEVLEGELGPIAFFEYKGDRVRAEYQNEALTIARRTRFEANFEDGSFRYEYGLGIDPQVSAYASPIDNADFKISGIDRIE